MSEVEFTKISSKGQVVIPRSIRDELGIEEGTPFAVWSKGDEILLKKVAIPAKKSWEQTTEPFRLIARERNITIDDINLAIQKRRAIKR